MQKYIVKSNEEEKGEEIWVVKVPDGISKDEAFKVLEMARRYAEYMDFSLEEKEGIAEYDEHYLKMAEKYETYNGQYAFNAYLELHGFEIEPLEYDFDYEW